ncbi:DUF4377 domain-containing protein [Providencia hangzhouensis]
MKENPSDNWQLFYSSIQGFEYQPGFSYTVQVKAIRCT